MTKKFTLSTLIAGTLLGTVSYLLMKPKELGRKVLKATSKEKDKDSDKNEDFTFI